MTKEEILHLLETEYLNGDIDIAEVKRRIGVDIYYSNEYVFTNLGIYDEFKKIQNKRRGLSTKRTNLARHGTGNGHKRIHPPKKEPTEYVFKCAICDKKIVSVHGIGMHIKSHKISNKEYYDIYLKKEDEGICKTCGKPTKWKGIMKGYNTYCDFSCINKNRHRKLSEETKQKIKQSQFDKYGCYAFNSDVQKQTLMDKYGVENPFQIPEVKAKIKETNKQRYGVEYPMQSPELRNNKKASLTKQQHKEQFEIENNCIEKAKLVEEFGWGWYQARIVEPIYLFESNGGYNVSFYKKEDIPKIREYSELHLEKQRSYKEVELVQFIKSFYTDEITIADRQLIKPKEIDIYLPKLKLGIEFNGIRFHSIELKLSKEYHLEKSLLCRNKGIRLIHIYEFEDFDEQKSLLKSLILGEDLYPIEDFNKNNLISAIPNPEIIYKDDKYTLYGAGKLY